MTVYEREEGRKEEEEDRKEVGGKEEEEEAVKKDGEEEGGLWQCLNQATWEGPGCVCDSWKEGRTEKGKQTRTM